VEREINHSIGQMKKFLKGFSVVETSIVLASIAALAMLAIGAANLIERANILVIADQVVEFREAIRDFRKRYGGTPGDLVKVEDVGLAAVTLTADEKRVRGNGIIDSGEELLLWQQLGQVGLIEGSYDGSSANKPGVGVPEGTLSGSGYKVVPSSGVTGVTSRAIIIDFAGFSSAGNGSNNLPVLTAKDAKHIDKRRDDGSANSGKIRAYMVDPDDGSEADCDYSSSSDDASCLMRFILFARPAATTTASSTPITCGNIGSTRDISGSSCPEGFTGRIVQTCTKTGWTASKEYCEAVKCQGGYSYGDSRVLTCQDYYTGSGTVQRCADSGLWEEVQDNCVISPPCAASETLQVPCVLGESGSNRYDCGASSNTDNCSPIKCGTNLLYTKRESTNCEGSFSGKIHEVCSFIDKTNAGWQPIISRCTHNKVGTACSDGDSPLNKSCPTWNSGKAWQDGSITITCINDVWVESRNTCVPRRCGNGLIGASRISEYTTCEDIKGPGSEGTAVEFCNHDGNWKFNNMNCI